MGHSLKKAMILAAGLGTRMAPVTDSIPKPLVPILNIPNIIHNIHLLKSAGIEEIVVNAFHLGPKLMDSLGDGKALGAKLRYSVEQTLLGTGGGVRFAKPLLGDEPFVLCNSDLITDLDLNAAIDFHFSNNALATMVLLDDAIKKRKYANVGTTSDNHLCQLPSKTTAAPKRTGIFTGIHVLQPEIHEYLQPVFSGINQVLYPALMTQHAERVFGYFAPPESTWLDTGEVPLFWDTSMKLLDDLKHAQKHLCSLLTAHGYVDRGQGVWVDADVSFPTPGDGVLVIGKNCKLASDAKLGPDVVLGEGCEVESGARVERSVLLPGSRVPAGAQISGKIVFGDRILNT